LLEDAPARTDDIVTSRRLENVDMLDIEELEQRRDNPGRMLTVEFQQGLTSE